MSISAPRILITPGEPAGIGPELVARIAASAAPARIVAVADPNLMSTRARELGIPLRVESYGEGSQVPPQEPGRLLVWPVRLQQGARCGVPDPANAPYVLECLRRAAGACANGDFDALVTGPVHKGVINAAGINFTGHTEFLAELSGNPPVVMVLQAPGLRVALVTTHLPLAQVSGAITQVRLESVIRVLDEGMRSRFALGRPRILVCGLNPHAGEQGYLGEEETQVIRPVLERLRTEGIQLQGPLPADTVFTPRQLEAADVVLAMYHDQGLPVLKHLGFGRAVNVTLGLPYVRTSVDHGTALDVACTGQADPGSLHAALEAAREMCSRRG